MIVLPLGVAAVVPVGPLVGLDGYTPNAGVLVSVVSRFDLIRSADVVSVKTRTWVATVAASGEYSLALLTTDLNAIGWMKLSLSNPATLAPWWLNILVVPVTTWNALVVNGTIASPVYLSPGAAAQTVSPNGGSVAIEVNQGTAGPDPLLPPIVDTLGVAIDLSAASLSMTVFSRETGAVLFTRTKAAGQLVVSGASNNEVTLLLDVTLTATPGVYGYELWKTDGDKIVLLKGRFEVLDTHEV